MSSRQEDGHPNRKSQTQQKDLPQKEDSLRNFFPTGRMTPKQLIKNPTGRLAPQRRLVMSSQQEDRPPKRKSQTHQKVLTQKEDSLNRKIRSKKETHSEIYLPTVRLLVNHAVARTRSCRGMVEQAQAMGSGMSARVWAPEPGSAGAWSPGLGPRPGDLASPSVSSTPAHDLQN